MSTHEPATHEIATDLPITELSRNHLYVPAALIALGVLVAVFGLFSAPERTWPNLLLDGFYAVSVTLSAIFFAATQRMTGARWSASLRRVPEAIMAGMPVTAVLMLLVLFGRHTLFPWTRPGIFDHAPAIAGKVQYLQEPFVYARMVVSLGLWVLFAWLFRKTSREQDRNPGASLAYHHKMNRYATVFVLVFAVSFTTGAFDWVISLDPSWFSTMFAVFVFAGTFVQGIAAVTLATVLLRERGYMRSAVSEHQLHDLGKMLFAFSVFWMYIWVCQYLLIWYGNIPDEVTHYIKRTNGPWLVLFVLNPIINWVFPFTVLMSVKAKCNPKVLRTVCIVLLVGHWLDLYLLIMPAEWDAPHFGLIEIPLALAYAAVVYLLTVRALPKAPLVPVNDPVMAADSLSPIHVH
jgi:hypothetical protein